MKPLRALAAVVLLAFACASTPGVAAEQTYTQRVSWKWSDGSCPGELRGFNFYTTTVEPAVGPSTGCSGQPGTLKLSVVNRRLVGEVRDPAQRSAVVTFSAEPGQRVWLLIAARGLQDDTSHSDFLDPVGYSTPLEITLPRLPLELPTEPKLEGAAALKPIL